MSLNTGFMVVHGNRIEDLRDVMLSWMQQHPLPPLTPEVMLVQSNGMNQWLVQSIAQQSGIAAGLKVSLPNEFIWQAYRHVLGQDAVPKQMVFDKPILMWRLMRLLPQLCETSPSIFAPLKRYLAADQDGRYRYQLAMQIADVFDQYQSYRADWLDDWSHGKDVLRSASGHQEPLPEEQCWQATLWRAIRDDIDVAQQDMSRAAVHAQFMRVMSDLTQRPAGLPPRVMVFGISTLPMQSVEALAMLGRVCQVMLFVQNPCRYYWGDIVEGRELLRRSLQHTQRHARKPEWSKDLSDDALHAQANPLLAAWGKQARDYIHALSAFDMPETYRQTISNVEVFYFFHFGVPRRAGFGVQYSIF